MISSNPADGYEPYALSSRYGQRHAIDSSRRASLRSGSAPRGTSCWTSTCACSARSALTGDHPVPMDRPAEVIGDGIPVTYVPARNTIFLSFALAWAEVLEARDIYLGVHALDYSGYPYCRPEYIGGATDRRKDDDRCSRRDRRRWVDRRNGRGPRPSELLQPAC